MQQEKRSSLALLALTPIGFEECSSCSFLCSWQVHILSEGLL